MILVDWSPSAMALFASRAENVVLNRSTPTKAEKPLKNDFFKLNPPFRF
jgi:hypothetical protein